MRQLEEIIADMRTLGSTFARKLDMASLISMVLTNDIRLVKRQELLLEQQQVVLAELRWLNLATEYLHVTAQEQNAQRRNVIQEIVSDLFTEDGSVATRSLAASRRRMEAINKLADKLEELNK